MDFKRIATEKQEIIIITAAIILTLFLRAYNMNELSGGDDAQFAEFTAFAMKEPKLIFFNEYPDEPIYMGGLKYARPLTFIPLVISTYIFGYTKLAILFPTLVFSALSVLVLFFIVKEELNRKVAYIAIFLLATSPFHTAFARNGLLHGALTFYWLVATYLIIRAIKTENNKLVYLAAMFCLFSQLTTDLRGLVPLIGLVPYVYMKKPSKNIIKHSILAIISAAAIYVAYITLPLILYGDSSYIQWFLNSILQGAGGESAYTVAHPISEVLRTFAGFLFLTPFAAALLVPLIFGIIKTAQKKSNPFSALLLTMLGSIIFFIISRQIYVERLVIYVPVFATVSAIALYSAYDALVNRKTNELTYLVHATIAYFILMLYVFPIAFPADASSLTNTLRASGLSFIFSKIFISSSAAIILISVVIFTHIASRYKKLRKSIAILLIATYLCINLALASGLVISGAGIFKRPEGIKTIADYINDHGGNEKYSCISNFYDKALMYYTQKPCLHWSTNESFIKNAVKEKNLRFVVVDNVYKSEGKSFEEQFPEKFEWVKNNSQDITEKTGLKHSKYFRLLEFNNY